MKFMEITIGRDAESTGLLLTVDGKDQTVVVSGGVPSSVGTHHCRLSIHNGQMRLKNLDVNNYTYVNGQSIESKSLTTDARIELGSARYLLDWTLLKPFLPVDITSLKAIWERYEKESMDLQIAERKFNTLRSLTGLITMIAIVLSIATGSRSHWYFLLYGLAITVSLVFFVKAYRDASNIPLRRQELNRKFQHDYVCPNCGHFMGNQSYDILVQNGNCTFCRKQFIH